MKASKVEGIVIRRRNSGEADRFLTIFTKQKGKIQVKAPSVRKITSRRSPHIELLNYCTLSLYAGHMFPLVTEAATIESFSEIKNDLSKVAYAYHVCELMNGLTAENQQNPGLFSLLLETLEGLTLTQRPAHLVHEFEIKLLTYLGFWSKTKFATAEGVHTTIEDLLEKKLSSKNIIMLFR